tara:strand:- start:1495 stop:1887 length:393 start_codon:yes stop_codon:yes gene_type:complete
MEAPLSCIKKGIKLKNFFSTLTAQFIIITFILYCFFHDIYKEFSVTVIPFIICSSYLMYYTNYREKCKINKLEWFLIDIIAHWSLFFLGIRYIKYWNVNYILYFFIYCVIWNFIFDSKKIYGYKINIFPK